MSEIVEDTSMWIAPCRYATNTPNPKMHWTVNDWKALTLTTEEDWKTAIEIFEDRIQYRYLDAVQALKKADDAYYRKNQQRRFGFAVMALDCLLLETLAQFYEGLKDSEKSGKSSSKFYIQFLTDKSFVLKKYFDDGETGKACIFYKTIRCGILHQAETKDSSLIRYVCDDNRLLPFELTEDGKGLLIYWNPFHKLMLREYEAYLRKLREGEEPYRGNFICKMNFICKP